MPIRNGSYSRNLFQAMQRQKKYEGQKSFVSRAHLHQICWMQEIMLKKPYKKMVQKRFEG
jgi:hypothetical protein